MLKRSRNHIRPLLSVAGICFTLMASTGSAQARPTQSLEAQTVAEYLSGLLVFERADGLKIHMTTCEVTSQFPRPSSESTEILLYQEQASHTELSKPYRQRFLKIRNINEAQVISESFRPKDNSRWVQLCNKPQRDRIFSHSDLQISHCTVLLKNMKKVIIGETPMQGCPSKFKGAIAVHNKIILTAEGMKTYDKGLDEKGNVVWGSRGKPYIFTKEVSP